MQRDGIKCDICGIELSKDKLRINHIYPQSPGGSNKLNNLRLLCSSCNAKYNENVHSGFEFEKYIYEILRKNNEFRNVEEDKIMGGIGRAL